ncbi:MAG: hypothetical protein M1358_17895 [Chloroflexi bacterium]|nr:hypothetical protein [Chloroflexota bacterium]
MTVKNSQTVDQTKSLADSKSLLEGPRRELIVYRLRCAQTANGLSHYYMYGDVDPEDTLL